MPLVVGLARVWKVHADLYAVSNSLVQMKQIMARFHSLIEDGNLEELSTVASEMESLEDLREEYMIQLETEQMLLLNKIKELGQEFFNSSPPSLSRRSSSG